ncbi:MAG TPA: ATP-binding protein [Isosphaeraceae bacterium]|jgi:signal transduction histidine kinase|nr:ATP-binding protein [Isosphaeraceae bacterium]
MKLSTRLSLFFLGALGLVLVGFSTSLYLLASKYLHRQADERLEAALFTLAAAAEVGPDGVEWEPQERSLSFGRRTIEGQFYWLVCDRRGRRLDGSSSGSLDDLLRQSMTTEPAARRPRDLVDQSGQTWRIMYRQLEPSARVGKSSSEHEDRVSSDGKHEVLWVGAGVSLEGVQATLRNLLLVLVGLSLGIWVLALGFSRRLCRRALRPVTEMAESAHSIGGHDLEQRLLIPDTDDELGELGRSFNALLDRVQESFERQRQFTGDASHQLRTPLTVMLGQVDLALRRARDVDEYQRVLTSVQRQGRHLRQIVESLLFLARADAEGLRPGLELIELAGWLDEHLRSRLEDPRALDVRQEIDAGGPFMVRAQPALLGELANNLLDNASKYCEPGTPIVVRLKRLGQFILLSVEDHGIGIPEEEIPRVFEPFYRSSESRKRGVGGLGLGLSVAQRLAHSFGASIEVQSELERGSCFTIRFTAESGSHTPAEPSMTTSSAAAT